MRLISFSMTLASFLDGTKTVTRRVGWKGLKAGDRLVAVEKALGLKKGERVKRLGVIEVVSVRRERLNEITRADVRREGVAGIETPEQFVRAFALANSCRHDAEVARIEFERVYDCIGHPDCADNPACSCHASCDHPRPPMRPPIPFKGGNEWRGSAGHEEAAEYL